VHAFSNNGFMFLSACLLCDPSLSKAAAHQAPPACPGASPRPPPCLACSAGLIQGDGCCRRLRGSSSTPARATSPRKLRPRASTLPSARSPTPPRHRVSSSAGASAAWQSNARKTRAQVEASTAASGRRWGLVKAAVAPWLVRLDARQRRAWEVWEGAEEAFPRAPHLFLYRHPPARPRAPAPPRARLTCPSHVAGRLAARRTPWCLRARCARLRRRTRPGCCARGCGPTPSRGTARRTARCSAQTRAATPARCARFARV